MPKSLPPPTPQLNRLRAASALIPIIEAGLNDGKFSTERAALMASFCEWATSVEPDDSDAIYLVESIVQGLHRLKVKLVAPNELDGG